MPQLIFRIMPAAGNHFYAVNYNEKKQKEGKAKMVCMKNFGHLQGKENVTTLELKTYFQQISSLNQRIKNPSFHASLSCKGSAVSHSQLMDYATEIMDGLGYGNQPLLMYAHRDTDNHHIHIVSTRVDYTGKKIPDKFEKKRAHSLLNAMLNRHPAMECEAHLLRFKNYHFTTQAQFNLLMESAGYKIKSDNEHHQYYKHGHSQGRISKAALDKLIANNSLSSSGQQQRIMQIKALFHKYQQTTSCTLSQTAYGKNDPEKLKVIEYGRFSSPFTELMKSKFGLECIFFTGKDHTIPYGYSLIDHSKQAVYKGSEIMALHQLQNNSLPEKSFTDSKINSNHSHPHSYTIPENTPFASSFFSAYDIEKETAHFIDKIVSDNYIRRQNNGSPNQDDLLMKKRKKKRYY